MKDRSTYLGFWGLLWLSVMRPRKLWGKMRLYTQSRNGDGMRPAVCEILVPLINRLGLGELREASLSVGDIYDNEYAQWDRGNIRGLGKNRRFVRVEKDELGHDVNVYEIEDDEWGDNYGERKPST